MLLTTKVRIFPSADQEKLLWILSEKCRLMYNFGLQERLLNYEQNRFLYNYLKPLWAFRDLPESDFKTNIPYITYYDQVKQIPLLRNERFPEYQWVQARVLGMSLKKLDANFKSFYSLAQRWNKKPQFDAISKRPINKPSPPRYIRKNFFMPLCFNQSGYKIISDLQTRLCNNERGNKREGVEIKFSHKHPSKIDLGFIIPRNIYPKDIEKVKQIEIFYDSNRKRDKAKAKYYLAITYEKRVPEYYDNGLYYAIDLGLDKIISGVNLHNKTLQIQNKARDIDIYFEKKIQEVQSRRDHCKVYYDGIGRILKRSRKWYFYNEKMIKLQSKRATQQRLFHHKISKLIVSNTKANTIIVGDLDTKQMAKRKRGKGKKSRTKAHKTLNRRLMSGGISRFVEFLTYKAEIVGKRIIKIDESYTSKRCCICGTILPLKLSDRNIRCNCGNYMDRDLNASRNIMLKFLEQKSSYNNLLPKPSLTEELFKKQFTTFSSVVRTDVS